MFRLALPLSLLLLSSVAVAQGPRARLDGDHIELLSPITFETAANTITPDGVLVLQEVVRILRLHPDIRIDVGVHTDATGMESFNQRISDTRAAAILAFLTHNGIAAGRIHVAGYGETMPIDSNSTTAGRERNRRVEIRVLRGS